MRNIICTILLIGLGISLSAQEQLKDVVYFDSKIVELDEAQTSRIQERVRGLEETVVSSIVLKGYTDNVGSPSDNIVLSQKRVETVRAILLGIGVPSNLIQIDALGETNPAASNTTKEGRRLNRRVEIVATYQWFFTEAESSSEEMEEMPPPSLDVLGDIRGYLKRLQSAPQVFCINPNRDTIIQGEKGTILFIDAGSFDVKTNENECLGIQLSEYYSVANILLHQLGTTSEGRLLETAGMINIEASYEGETVLLESNAGIDLYFPSVKQGEGYQLFNGEMDEDNQVNWVPSTLRAYNTAGTMRGHHSYDPCEHKKFIAKWICRRKGRRQIAKTVAEQKRLQEEKIAYYQEVDFSEMVSDLTAGENQSAIFTTFNLGLINCDRFINEFAAEDLFDKVLVAETGSYITTGIVFKNYKSVLPGKFKARTKYDFFNLPPEEEITIYGIKYVNNQVRLAIKETTISDQDWGWSTLGFYRVSEEEFRAALSGMEW